MRTQTFLLAMRPASKHLPVKQRHEAAEHCKNQNSGFAGFPLGKPLPTQAAPDISEGIVSPSLGSLGLEENSPWPSLTDERR